MKKNKKHARNEVTHNNPLPQTNATPPGDTTKNEDLGKNSGGNEKALKKVFFISLAVMLVIFWTSGYNVGYHMDEMDMNSLGKANYAWYFSGGKDTSYLHAAVECPANSRRVTEDTLLRYYGSAFDYIAVGFNKMAGLENTRHEFNSRHIFNQFFALLAIFFAGLTAFKISGWRAAIFTQWLLFLTPSFFGLALFNTKDIPFCTGYIASVYFIILFVRELPSPTWRTALFLMFSFAFTTSTRMGGMLIAFYLFLFIAFYLFKKRGLRDGIIKNIRPIAIKLFAVVGGGISIVILASPFLLRAPFRNFIGTINFVNSFPYKISFLFEGEMISSLQVPAYFLPKALLITIPVFIIAAFIVSLFFLLNKKLDRGLILFILFTSFFPLAYAVFKEVSIYHTWRHFTFFYPGMVIMTGVGLNEIMDGIRKPLLQKYFLFFCVAAMLHPIIWSIRNHPFEYAYFNEAEGGFKNAYDIYETDYWTISVKNGVDWLMKNEPIEGSKDTVKIGTNAPLFVDHYINVNYPKAKVKVVKIAVKTRSSFEWTYAVMANIFITASEYENDLPLYGSVHNIDVDHLPVTMILRDTTRYDNAGINAMLRYQWAAADSLFELYQRQGGKSNKSLYGYIGIIKAMKGDPAAAMDLGQKAISYYDAASPGYIAIGLAYLRQNKTTEALPYLWQAYILSSRSSWPIQFYKALNPQLIKLLEQKYGERVL